jgi:hypothetical protein
MKNWKFDEKHRIPDFIICGAMKSGTTTLHAILAKHPKVFIPDPELHFFDQDDIFQHSDFSWFKQGQWYGRCEEKQQQDSKQWYLQQFSSAKPDDVLGEDSTTYLASTLAFKRIAAQSKAIKIVVILRQPTARAYSQYWHMLRTGRATYNFEDTLEYCPETIINRSLYLTQLQHLYALFPREQIKVVLFEDFLADREKTIHSICQFIGVDESLLSSEALALHENSASLPKYLLLQRLKNRWLRKAGNIAYQQYFSLSAEKPFWQNLSCVKVVDALHRKINPLIAKKPPKINVATKAYLDSYFSEHLQGINELLQRDVLTIWFPKN